MPITLNGTTGVTLPTTNGIINTPSGTNLQLQINGTTNATLDTSGNLGLGATPSAWAGSYKVYETPAGFLGATGTNYLFVGSNCYADAGGFKYKNTAATSLFEAGIDGFKWRLAPSGTAGNAITFTQAMTLDASGNLLVGTTSNPDNNRINVKQSAANSTIGVYAGTGGGLLNWYKNDNTFLASVTFSGSTVTYGTGSDYRLKENVQPISNALAKVAALRPVAFTWKDDGSYGESFIAHELQELYPTAVNGTKDAVDSEGKPRYQGVDTSKLVAVLTAAIQELNAKVEAQAAEIAALKGAA